MLAQQQSIENHANSQVSIFDAILYTTHDAEGKHDEGRGKKKRSNPHERKRRKKNTSSNNGFLVEHLVRFVSSTMAEHVDDVRLHSDLRYRFDYLSKFLNFTSDDITMLNAFAPVLFPVIPVIADTVYRKLFSFDITKNYFLVRNEGFEGFLPRKTHGVSLDSPQMELRKDMLSIYLKRVFTQREWNDTFLQFLSQVGKIHTNQAGSASINVDYIHINALLGHLEHLLIDVLQKCDTLDETNKHGILVAVNKFFWIQNDFFTMHYLLSIKDNSGQSMTKSTSSDKKPTCCWM